MMTPALPPGLHKLSAKPDEPFDLGPLLLFAAHVQVEMGHVGLVQQERRAFATWRHQHALMAVGPAHITQGVTPEGCRPADIGDVQHH